MACLAFGGYNIFLNLKIIRFFKNINQGALLVDYKILECAWMNITLFKNWLC